MPKIQRTTKKSLSLWAMALQLASAVLSAIINLSEHSKRAFKRATSWYDQEVQKGKDGLSSYEVAKRVKVEFGGVGLSA